VRVYSEPIGGDRILRHRSVKMELPHFVKTGAASLESHQHGPLARSPLGSGATIGETPRTFGSCYQALNAS
jgi:hypothetical protein